MFDGGNFEKSIITKIADMKTLWGQGFEEPMIAIENLALTKYNVMLLSKDKSPTLKITLPNGVEVMKFKSSVEEYERLIDNACTKINLVGTCSSNFWGGITTPQIIIEDYEITQNLQYYF